MADERLIQRLEEQLSEAHATNGSLREQLGEATKNADALNALRAEVGGLNLRLEKAEAKRKAAEDNAQAALREQREAKSKVPRLKEENEDLQARLVRARAEADRLAELNAKVEQAKSIP